MGEVIEIVFVSPLVRATANLTGHIGKDFISDKDLHDEMK